MNYLIRNGQKSAGYRSVLSPTVEKLRKKQIITKEEIKIEIGERGD